MRAIPTIVLAVSAAALAGAGLWLWTPDLSRAGLEARYLASPEEMREVAGMRLRVRDTGPKDAPAIVMLHGFGSSLDTWEPWARALDSQHRVVRYDMPGAGLSPPDSTGDYTDARAIAVLAALMDQLGFQRASLIGNSIGGRVAWKFAALKPERVTKLVLISPDGFASPGFEYGRAPNVPAAVAILKYVLPKPLMRMNLAPAYGDPSRLTEATIDRYYDLMRAPGVRGAMIDRMKQTILEDPAPLLRRITAPILLLWGEKDGMIPVANAADYRRILPDSALNLLPGLGHVPMEEAPAESLPPVSAFLDR
jgi:pimeloyl-ACP methyl ester carboxylesterase